MSLSKSALKRQNSPALPDLNLAHPSTFNCPQCLEVLHLCRAHSDETLPCPPHTGSQQVRRKQGLQRPFWPQHEQRGPITQHPISNADYKLTTVDSFARLLLEESLPIRALVIREGTAFQTSLRSHRRNDITQKFPVNPLFPPRLLLLTSGSSSFITACTHGAALVLGSRTATG